MNGFGAGILTDGDVTLTNSQIDNATGGSGGRDPRRASGPSP